MGVRIRSTEAVYRGWATVLAATMEADDGATFRREIEDHGSGVAVLPYDPERFVALLVRLPRAPVLHGGETEDLLEAPAGLIDAGEAAAECARREALEEAGVVLGDLDPVGRMWTMPGVSTERMDLFLAPFRPADRTGPGGGLAEEHENITVVEMPLARLAALADRGEITDLKTFALVQALRLRRPGLFS